MRGLTFNNKTLFLSAEPKQYKSFMLVVNGNAIPNVDYNIMEIGDLAINDMSGFNYVTANPTASLQGINPPSYCVDGNTGTKWMTTQWWTDTTQSGMVIFTVNDPIVPSSYKLFNANDAADRDGSKLPGPRALYGSTGTPTTSSDASWELLSYTDYKLPVENYVWTSAMPTSNEQRSIECVLGFDDNFGYKTVKIGNQTWFAENLHDDDGQGGVYTAHPVVNGVDLGVQYYYTWDAATRIAQNYPGWHLATTADYNTLTAYAGANSTAACQALRSTSGWNNNSNGTDLYGYNCLPAGGIEPGGTFFNAGVEGTVWEAENHYRIYMLHNNTMVNGYEGNSYKFPIRLVKNS